MNMPYGARTTTATQQNTPTFAGRRGGPMTRVGAADPATKTTWQKIKDQFNKRYAGIPLYAWTGLVVGLGGIYLAYDSGMLGRTSGDRHRHHYRRY